MVIMTQDKDQPGEETRISTVRELGQVIQNTRKGQGLTQVDISGLAHTGNRFVVDLEHGKPTIQMQKALDVLGLLGLELVVRNKGASQ
jgi:HTH-type transcriptional regulator/antitoxin HipB